MFPAVHSQACCDWRSQPDAKTSDELKGTNENIPVGEFHLRVYAKDIIVYFDVWYTEVSLTFWHLIKVIYKHWFIHFWTTFLTYVLMVWWLNKETGLFEHLCSWAPWRNFNWCRQSNNLPQSNKIVCVLILNIRYKTNLRKLRSIVYIYQTLDISR